MNNQKWLESGSVSDVIGIANAGPNQSTQAERLWLKKG
jgi:hypothetical protein